MSDPKPIRYPRGHVSNVFSNVNWHNEAPYYGYAPKRSEPVDEVAAWNEERARERYEFQLENERRRSATLKAWEEEKARAEYEASPEGRSERDREWRKAFGGKDRTK
jgi:hypothetical protein